MTRTTFTSPTLADGRDLLYHIIPKESKKEEKKAHEEMGESNEAEWRPSMNLYELIQYIPDFIEHTLILQNGNDKNKAP